MTQAGNPLLTPAAFQRTVYPASRVSSVARSESRKVAPKEIEDYQVLHYSIPNVQQYEAGLMEDGSDIDSDKWLIERAVVLVSRLNPRKGTVIHVDHGGEFAVASTEFVPLCTGNKGDDRLLAYILGSQVVASYLDSMARSTTRSHQRVQPSQIRALGVPWAKNAEDRRAIVDFLDRETAQIDAMIEAQAEVVRLADERRAAVVAEEIARFGTKSPAVALRHCLRVQAGVTLGNQYAEDLTEYPYLRVANVQAGYLDLEVVKTICVPSGVAAASTLQPGDVLITEGGDRAALGRGALWRGEIPGALHQNHIFALRCGPLLDPEFLVYVLEAPNARIYFESTRRQTTNLSSTNSAKVKAFKTPLPTISEQRRIVERLGQALGRVDDVIASAQQVITLLRERREALITAAVTGRIDPVTGIERVVPTTEMEAS